MGQNLQGFAMEMTRRGKTVASPNPQVDPPPALGNPHAARVSTFPQRRRRPDACQAERQTPLKSWPSSDSCTEPTTYGRVGVFKHIMVTTIASHIRQLHCGPIIFGIVVLCLAAIGALSQATPASGQDLDMLLSKKQYLQLEQALQTQREELPEQVRSYFSGVMANRLNQINESLQRLEPLIPNLVITNPVRAEVALCTVADDYAKIYRYADASRVYTEASRVSKQQNLPPPCEAIREASRWALLSNAPAQTVTSAGQFTIQGRRDALGLIQVPVSMGGYAGSWILDSGANLSIISRS